MPTKKTSEIPAVDRIREIAYKLWLEAGQPEGQDTTHWLEAEALLAQTANAPATKKPATRAKKAA